jgi:hypothetical protein
MITLLESYAGTEKARQDEAAGQQRHQTIRVLSNGRQIGTLGWRIDSARAMTLVFRVETADAEALDELVERLIERLQRAERPLRYLAETDDRMMRAALMRHLFYPKGRRLQRLVEPWRLALPDKVFDDLGYIINQGEMKQIPFGYFNTLEKGCGWIAAYNLLKMNGREHTMKEVAERLGRHAFLGEFMGQDIMSLYFYLKKEGLQVRINPYGRRRVLAAMAKGNTGILLYTHTRGAHYTAWKKMPNGSFHFFNAVYGLKYQVMTGEEFLKKYSLPLSTMVITA